MLFRNSLTCIINSSTLRRQFLRHILFFPRLIKLSLVVEQKLINRDLLLTLRWRRVKCVSEHSEICIFDISHIFRRKKYSRKKRRKKRTNYRRVWRMRKFVIIITSSSIWCYRRAKIAADAQHGLIAQTLKDLLFSVRPHQQISEPHNIEGILETAIDSSAWQEPLNLRASSFTPIVTSICNLLQFY